ncbi:MULTISPECIES: TonB-dependent receptor [unclassified Hyphomicrobium]|uniref:TonB-dependent receptor family protein n=1 Tax=unclassified Hyphomicrobium TaxID=2619925 RepID=UPI000213D5E2|nr:MULTISPECIES: TonB-dependent receptor [unclassified Hyphomicrobium]CCB65666.1 TonB-dependent receptor [Hyphomicrobium sp. MC1]
MQLLKGRDRAAPVPVCAAGASIALLCFIATTIAHAQDADPEAVQLPDVNIEQTKPEQAKTTAGKPKTKPATTSKTANAAKRPRAAQSLPDEVAGSSLRTNSNANPFSGNPGTPSAGVAGVPGASGAGAQTATAVDMKVFEDTPVFSVTDILDTVPGVSLKQGNGPRDMGISIRGSNARNGFAIRNIVILDDGFPVTQPDGLSRSDLIDPHAYADVDVWRGPSSALFGNYATGGAINFRTYPGGAINGIEYGLDVGSFNYLNNYVLGGKKGDNWEASVFTSDVRGDGYFGYSGFNTQTVNALLTYQPSSTDTFTFKFINNNVDAELPFRTSLQQFRENPFQKGCQTAATAAEGCATNKFSGTGNTSTGIAQTAEQAGAGRDDRRTIGGFRWEHAFDAATTGQTQVVVDDRNINQPTGTTSSVGDYLSYNVISGVTHRSTIAGLPTLGYLGAFWNYLPVDGKTFNVAPGGDAQRGLLQSEQTGSTTNVGARARQEVKLTDDVSVIAGATVERTSLDGSQRGYVYNADGTINKINFVSADRDLTNIAPEVGVLYAPSREWQWRARVGTGYGTPQFSNLFVTPEGLPGNNTELKSQTNVGFDVGADWTPTPGVVLSVTGFYEFFKNELVSQSPGAGLPNFTFNAPASEHRGIEASANVALGHGFRLTASYTFDDQIYTDYAERLSGATEAVSRNGNKIPGVAPNEVSTRLSYDVPSGAFKGVGAYAEYEWHDSFFMENANLLKAPGYDLVNLNIHYNKDLSGGGPIKSLMAYFEVQNVLDETYIASANNITDRVGAGADDLAATSGSIYAGAPRTFYGGMKLKF